MTPRERSLLIIFFVALAAALLALGLNLYFERLTRLDAEFIDLQRHALRTASTSLVAQNQGDHSSLSQLKERFFAPGTLPDPLKLASLAETALKSSGLRVEESRVTENSKSGQWIQYRADGNIESWFRFLQLIRSQDPQTLFRSLSLVKKQGFAYIIAFEVGHAVLP